MRVGAPRGVVEAERCAPRNRSSAKRGRAPSPGEAGADDDDLVLSLVGRAHQPRRP
jgi:hypothetical protein